MRDSVQTKLSNDRYSEAYRIEQCHNNIDIDGATFGQYEINVGGVAACEQFIVRAEPKCQQKAKQ